MHVFYRFHNISIWTLISFLLIFIVCDFADLVSVLAAEMGEGYNMLAAKLGDRKAVIVFDTEPSQLAAGKNIDFNFKLTDNKTGNNIPHVTYLVSVIKEGTETLHTHDGNMKVLFVPDGTSPYKINANFDGLSASYVSDFGSLIKVNGQIFS